MLSYGSYTLLVQVELQIFDKKLNSSRCYEVGYPGRRLSPPSFVILGEIALNSDYAPTVRRSY